MEAVMDPYSKQVANYLASMLQKGKFRQDCGNNSQQEINNIYAQWHLGWTQHILSISAYVGASLAISCGLQLGGQASWIHPGSKDGGFPVPKISAI